MTTHTLDRHEGAVDERIDGPQAAARKSEGQGKTASLYRMTMPDHLCPFGLKSRALLKWNGYEVDDNPLTTRAETDAFQEAHGVNTTPQTFINGERIGGYDDLKRFFGKTVLSDKATSYTPVIAIFATTALMALAVCLNMYGSVPPLTWLKFFVAFAMTALAIQKLQDVESFVNMFLGYDLLSQRVVPYGYAYPYAEAYTGIGMIALIGRDTPLIWLVAPVGIFIGTVGAISVFKAVYVDKRELTCACVGGGSNVPLGVISLTENLMMAGLGIWMLAEYLLR